LVKFCPQEIKFFHEKINDPMMICNQTCAASHKVKSSQSHDFDFFVKKQKSQSHDLDFDLTF
jgi:hypothetical protein